MKINTLKTSSYCLLCLEDFEFTRPSQGHEGENVRPEWAAVLNKGVCPVAHVYLLTSFLSSLFLFSFPWVVSPSLKISGLQYLIPPLPLIQHPHGLPYVVSWLWLPWYQHRRCLEVGEIFHLPSVVPGPFLAK